MISSILKLIRWPNILVVIFSLLFIRYMVILPGLGISANQGMNVFNFILLEIATVSIVIGGYLINDLTDLDADKINKPGRNVVGTVFSEDKIKVAYYVVNAIAVVTGTWIAVNLHRPEYAPISLLTVGLLWFYSKKYKCQAVVGNVVVAFMSAFSFGLVWLCDFIAIIQNEALLQAVGNRLVITTYLVLIYMGFAFIVSFAREVVKDMEDYEGDNRYGCRTFPVAYGLSPSKTLVIVILTLGFLFSGYVQYYFYRQGFMSLYYFFYVIDILFILNIKRMLKAGGKSDFGMLSSHLKVLMAAGIISIILCFIDLSYAA